MSHRATEGQPTASFAGKPPYRYHFVSAPRGLLETAAVTSALVPRGDAPGAVSPATPLRVGTGQPRYDAPDSCLWHQAAGSVPLKSSRRSARGGWARSIERATRNSTVTSR